MKYLLTLALWAFASLSFANGGFILRNVNVVNVEHQRIDTGVDIVVRQGLISAVTPDTTSITDLPVINGNGGFVTPGLIDMHVHTYEPAAYSLALSHGVTHVRVMNGMPDQLKWRDQVAAGTLIGSSSTVSSPIMSGYLDSYQHDGIVDSHHAIRSIRKYQAQGYDLIKLYNNLDATIMQTIIDESQRQGLPIAKHGPHGVEGLPLSAFSGLQSFEHVEDIYQGAMNHSRNLDILPPIIDDIKATGVYITPTLNIYDRLTQLTVHKQAYLDNTHPQYTSTLVAWADKRNQVNRWLNASRRMGDHNISIRYLLLQITQQLHQNDVPLLVGSDSGVLMSPHGLATHNELALLVEAGLSPYNALAAATINAADALGLQHAMGEIKPGLQADFIYTRENPIDDLSVLTYPAAVAKEGRLLTKDDLAQLRNEAIANRSLLSELITHIRHLFDT